jgi:serine/threonine-protein kinase
MAPEQIDGASDIGPRADVWALGVVAYECLVARPPFEADDYDPLFRLIRSGQHTPPSTANNALLPAVDDWFLRACAKSPHDRFPTAGEAMDALASALDVVEPAPPSMPLSRSGSSPQAMGPETVGEIPVARPSGLAERYAMELEGADESADLELEDVRPPSRAMLTSMPAPGSDRSSPISTPRSPSIPRAPRPSERPPSPPWLPIAVGGGALLVIVAVVAALLVR